MSWGNKNIYDTRDLLIIANSTTSLALAGVPMEERTGSRVS